MDSITPTALADLDAPYILDVREQDEYDAGHVPGVELIPLGELAGRADEVPTDRTVYVICHSGGRSARAAQFLAERGVPAVNVDGGTSAWIEARLPVDR